jgi:hypothetical protein
MEKRCHRCGRSQPSGSAFCADCGAPLRAARSRRRGFPWVLVLSVSLALVIGLFFGALFIFRDRQETSANRDSAVPGSEGAVPGEVQARESTPVLSVGRMIIRDRGGEQILELDGIAIDGGGWPCRSGPAWGEKPGPSNQPNSPPRPSTRDSGSRECPSRSGGLIRVRAQARRPWRHGMRRPPSLA